jgi:penicillin-binding protein 2
MFLFPPSKKGDELRSSSRFTKSRVFEDIEPHEILLDSLAKKKEAELGISERKLEVPLLRKILQVFFLFSFLLVLALFARTFQFQVVEGKKFSQLAQENKYIWRQIQAERGVVYDKNFHQLIFNQPNFDLILDTRDLPQSENEKERIFKEISEIIKKDVEELKKEIVQSDFPQILVSENLSHQQLIILETKIKELPGFQIKNNAVRYYPEGENFAHLIGYTGKIKADELKTAADFYSVNDWVGRAGIENFYEEVLRKNPGKLKVERDALGNIISKEIISLPESGKSLVLWLDANLQRKIKEELEKELQIIGSNKAAAVALDPKTGGVLALVSLPSFDNNLFQKGADLDALKKLLEDPEEPLFNRVISGRYLTGSTIKPLIASAVLEEKIIDPDKKINCQGKIIIPNPWIPNASSTKKDWTVHGWTDLRKAIAESCNVYFYTVGGGFGKQEGLGPTKIKEYLEFFGWSDITGIDLPGETEGFVPDKEWKRETFGKGWWDGDTYNLSIGQGFLQITPLEVVTAMTAIANGGRLYQPQIVQKIVDKEKNIIKEIKPKIIRENFIDPQNLQIVREGMRQAVTGKNSPQASAVLLNSLPVKVAAKTGTAELGKDHYHNWITVFAPYDEPEIVLTIMIEDVKGLQAAALPVAKNILEWYFAREHNF